MLGIGKRSLLWLIVAGGLLAAAGPLARSARGQAAPAEELTAQAIRQDIETFQMFYRLRLTKAQATAMAGVVEPLVAERKRVEELLNRPEVTEVLLAMREAALAGESMEGLWGKLAEAERGVGLRAEEGEEGGDARDRLWRQAHEAMAALLPSFEPDQLAALASPELDWQVEEFLEQVRHARALPPAEWARWRDERIKELAARRPDEAAQLGAEVAKIFDLARSLTPDQFFEGRDQLAQDLREALAPPLGEAELKERATGRLAGLLMEHPRLATCLTEYAQKQP